MLLFFLAATDTEKYCFQTLSAIIVDRRYYCAKIMNFTRKALKNIPEDVDGTNIASKLQIVGGLACLLLGKSFLLTVGLFYVRLKFCVVFLVNGRKLVWSLLLPASPVWKLDLAFLPTVLPPFVKRTYVKRPQSK